MTRQPRDTRRATRVFLALGMAAVTLLLVAALAVGGWSPGPDEATPGLEQYHIYDGREGLQIEPEVINASRGARYFGTPALGEPFMTIIFGRSPTMSYSEIYTADGELFAKTTIIDGEGTMVNAEGNKIGTVHQESPVLEVQMPSHPLYSYRYNFALSPYWLVSLQTA